MHNDCRKGHYVKDEHGNIKCRTERVGVYGSVKSAETAIGKMVEAEKEELYASKYWGKRFGYVLDEVYLDDGLDKQCYPAGFESRRTYLNDGTLNCFSDIDWRCTKKFYGRTSPQYIKSSMTAKEYRDFKKNGVLAYEWRETCLAPILLTEFALTAKEWKARMKPGVCGDVVDDSGVAYGFNGGHFHPFSPDVFPLSALVCAKPTKKLVERLKRNRDAGF